MNKRYRLLCITPILLLNSFFVQAQVVKPPVALVKDSSKKANVLTPSFGPYSNGSKAFATDIKRLLLTKPNIKLKDSKGTIYVVTSFELLWKKKDITDDIRTGKRKTVYQYAGGNVKGNALPDEWQKEINSFLQKGEEITFDKILYQDVVNKKTYKAPPLTITIL
jgi:hypothetical protein